MAVYFIQAGENGLIKIGFAKNVAKRLVKMQVDCPVPLRVIGVLQGERADEAGAHKRFAGDRARGEWFRPSDELSAYVATLPQVSIRAQRRRRMYRFRPADRAHDYEITGVPKYTRGVGPSIPGREGGASPTRLPVQDAEFARLALRRLREDNPDEWPEWWLDWLRERGVSDRKIGRWYNLHLPVRPLSTDLFGDPIRVPEPVWALPNYEQHNALWPNHSDLSRSPGAESPAPSRSPITTTPQT
jgi:hypothetical protein